MKLKVSSTSNEQIFAADAQRPKANITEPPFYDFRNVKYIAVYEVPNIVLSRGNN